MKVAVGVAVAGAWSLLVAACTKPNPEYCDDTSTCLDGRICDVSIHTCVEPNAVDASTSCSSNDECTDAANPVCGEFQTCRACVLDDECASGVCREDGQCVASGDVLYVSTTGIAAGQCPASSPCELAYALTLTNDTRSSLRLANGTYLLPGAIVIGGLPPVALVGGRGAVFSRTSPGPSFDVRDGGSLSLRGVTVTRGLDCLASTLHVRRVAFGDPGSETRPWISTNGCDVSIAASEFTGSKSHGIDAAYGSLKLATTRITMSQGSGIRVMEGTLDISQTEVFGNQGIGLDATITTKATITRSRINENRMGGLSCVGTGVFELVNNFIYYNGNFSTATFGGVKMAATGQHRIEHNSIIYNERAYSTTPPVYAGGIYCEGPGSNANNLIAYNFHGNTTEPAASTNGTCDFADSIVSPDMATFQFVRPFAFPLDYHIANAQSDAVDVGVSLAAPVSEDYDGDPRSDGVPDVGADEFVP